MLAKDLKTFAFWFFILFVLLLGLLAVRSSLTLDALQTERERIQAY